MLPRRKLLARLALLAAILGAGGTPGGCMWRYNRPPAAASSPAKAVRAPTSRPSVVIGAFGNPAWSPQPWKNIGPGMSEALAGALLHDTEIEVWMDAPLANRVAGLMTKPADQRERELAKVRAQHPTLRYAVTGRVTDFTHSDDVPKEVRRWGLFGRRHEAVVALQLNVIDLESGRVIASDHIHGVADAPKRPSRELYEDMTFGSYLFWNSPLGKASEEVVRRATKVVHAAVPPEAGEIRIVRQMSSREVSLSDELRGSPSDLFYVCLVDPLTGEHSPVVDPDTGEPLKVQADSGERASKTAWLVGRKPLTTDLRGAVLCPVPVTAPMVADAPHSH